MQIVTSALSRVSGMVFGPVQQESSPQDQPDTQAETKSTARKEPIADMPKATRSQSAKEAATPRQRTESARAVSVVTYNYPSSHPPAATILSDDRRREERRKDRHRVLTDRRVSREDLNALEERNRALENRLQETSNVIQSRESHIRVLEAQLTQQLKTLQLAEQENAQISELLEVRTAELKSAQTFLTTADKWSGNEVISKVQSLNSEILQAAAQASEPLVHQRLDKKPTFSEDLISSLGQRNLSFLEERLVKGSDDIDHLIQLFLQHVMIHWSTWIINSWNLWDTRLSESLRSIYHGIQRAEDPSVARRWRAMTLAQLRISPEKQEHLAGDILRYVEGLLQSCGQRQSVDHLKNRISAIVKIAAEIRVAIKEGVTSAYLDIMMAYPETSFDSATMEDEEGNGNKAKGRTSCCTQLGLYREISTRDSGGSVVNQRNILIKPKVVLYSSLRE